MKKIKNTLLLLLSVIAGGANAQLVLPQPSPKATVTQQVGLTEVTIEYSSPGVKGRKIWGDLVAYDKVWRAGANAATKITFSKDVVIENTNVPKGSYSIFVIPSANKDWVVIFNKDDKASEGSYSQDNDIVRVNVKPLDNPHAERLAYSITDFDDNAAKINLVWEKVKLSVAVKCDTEKQSLDAINSSLSGSYRNYLSAARYMLDTKKDYDAGLKYIDQAIQLSPDQWFSYWVKAQLLKEKGKVKEALDAARKAKELGDKKPENFFYKSEVEKALNEWKAPSAK